MRCPLLICLLVLSGSLFLVGPAMAAAAGAPEPLQCPPALAGDGQASCGIVRLPTGTDGPAPAQEIFFAQLDGGPGAPMLLIPGGPGMSASVDLAVWRDRLARWRLARTIILFDPRGTGLSRPSLDCPAIRSALDLDRDRIDDCRKRLDLAGAAPAALSSAVLARDITRLRKALGIEHWFLYGISHGTRLALLAAQDDPDHVAGLVLDSLRPPWRPFYDDRLAAGRATIMAALVDECRRSADCQRHYPRLGMALAILFPDWPRTSPPMQAGAVTALMSAPDTRNLAPAAATALADGGDPALVAALDAMQAPTRIALGHHLALTCREDMPGPGDAPQSLSHRLPYMAMCAAWGAVPEPAVEPAMPSGLPVLVLAGSWDAVTPPDPGGVASHLPGALFVPVAGAGHDVLSTSACANDLVQRFLAAPATVRRSSCTGGAAPAPPVPGPAEARRALLTLAGMAG